MKFFENLPAFILGTLGALAVGSFLLFSILSVFVPAPEPREPASRNLPAERTVKTEIPQRIVIDKAGVDAVIRNPESTSVSVLDQELAYGAVRYPGSGLPGEGNMFLFGHSSGLPFVRNQAYKTFNGIQFLERGDRILIYSDNHEYEYRVLRVKLVDKDEALVSFNGSQHMLTLSTCNTFGEKQERFVVEADFVRSRSID